MGNASGIILPVQNGRIYKVIDCGCICSLVYKQYCTENIELLCPCYNCLLDIKEKKYNTNKISRLFRNSVNKNIFELTERKNVEHWLLESDAIEYAKKRKIPYEELVPNDDFEYMNPTYQKKDLLKRYDIYL